MGEHRRRFVGHPELHGQLDQGGPQVRVPPLRTRPRRQLNARLGRHNLHHAERAVARRGHQGWGHRGNAPRVRSRPLCQRVGRAALGRRRLDVDDGQRHQRGRRPRMARPARQVGARRHGRLPRAGEARLARLRVGEIELRHHDHAAARPEGDGAHGSRDRRPGIHNMGSEPS